VALLREARLEKPFLVGHSMGGGVALQITLDFPDLPGGLVLVGSGAKLGVSPRILQLIEEDPAGAVKQITAFAYSETAPPEMIQEGETNLALCHPEVLMADFRACNGFDVRDRIRSIEIPTLVVCGDADRLTFPRFSAWLADTIPGARLLLVQGGGHLVMLEKPDDVSNGIAEFLAGLPGGGTRSGGREF
jgi:pimeloyl-ACP methyl ester carboxylesterase